MTNPVIAMRGGREEDDRLIGWREGYRNKKKRGNFNIKGMAGGQSHDAKAVNLVVDVLSLVHSYVNPFHITTVYERVVVSYLTGSS